MNRSNIYGFSVTTTDANLTAVLTAANVAAAQATRINSIDFVVTGGSAYVFPDVGATDLLASDITAADTTLVVTTVGSFAVGDWIYVFEPGDYTTWEIKRIKSINSLTSTLTVESAFANNYNTLDSATIWVIGGKQRFIPMINGYVWGKEGIVWKSLYIRRMSAANITIQGTAVLV